MSLYENASCPVCGKPFEQGDDVVFCPECGTPHHRACMKQTGHCANEARHGQGFNYFEQQKSARAENIVEEAKARFHEQRQQSGDADGETAAPPFGAFTFPQFANAYTADTDTIDGESIADVAAAIGSNAPRFVAIFKHMEKEKRKRSWNWGAFLLGPFYFLYRKMFKEGFLLLALNLAVNYASSLLLEKLAPVATGIWTEYMQQLATGKLGAEDIAAYAEQFGGAADYRNYILIYALGMLALIVIRVFFAVLADHLYKKTVKGIIRSVTAAFEEDGDITVPSEDETAPGYTKEQMRRLYLARRGGTSLVFPAFAMILLYVLNMLL